MPLWALLIHDKVVCVPSINAFADQWLSCVNRLVVCANQKQIFENILLAAIGVATSLTLLRLDGFFLDRVAAMFGGPVG